MGGTRAPGGRRALFLLEHLPLPVRGGSDLRSLRLVRSIPSPGKAAVFALSPTPAPPATEPEWFSAPGEVRTEAELGRAMLRSMTGRDGQPGDYLWTATARHALLDLVRSWQPDVGIVRLGAGPALEVLKGAVPKLVYDAHNVEGPLYRRIMAANVPEGASAPTLLLRTADRTDAAEGALASAVDQIWVCSDQDARAMRDQYPGCAPVVVVPNTVAVPPELPARATMAKQHLRLVYPASFGYHPNVQAARWLSAEVLPRLRQAVPDAGLVLVGSGTPAALNLLARGGEGIEVAGPVPSLDPYWDQATAVPVALRDGGGTRLKALEAFAAGVPVIGTAKGLEGLDVVAGEHFLLADDALQVVDATIRIWHEPELRAYLSANAYHLARERYGPTAAEAAITRALSALS